MKKLVVAGNIDRAIKLCEASDYPVLQLVKAGLTHAHKGGSLQHAPAVDHATRPQRARCLVNVFG